MDSTERKGLWVGLGVSALLHLCVLLYAVTRVEKPLSWPKQAAIEVVVVEIAAPQPPPEPPAPAPVPEMPPPPRPTPRIAPDTPPVAVTPAPTLEEPAPTQDATPLALPPTRLTLVPGSGFTLSLDAGTQVAIVNTPQLDTPASPQALMNQLAVETLGRGKVERGLVHPYYSQLGKVLIASWDAERVIAQGGLKQYGGQLKENAKLMGGLWQDRAEQYARTSSPLEGAGSEGPRQAPLNDRVGGIPGVDLEARKQIRRQMKEQFQATRRATVRVVQSPEGKLLRVELVEPSNDPSVDKEAMKDISNAAARLPRPPDEAVGGRPQLTSLWSFELIVSISPPIPTFSFEFDEQLGVTDIRLPLDRRIYKKVRLVSVE